MSFPKADAVVLIHCTWEDVKGPDNLAPTMFKMSKKDNYKYVTLSKATDLAKKIFSLN